MQLRSNPSVSKGWSIHFPGWTATDICIPVFSNSPGIMIMHYMEREHPDWIECTTLEDYKLLKLFMLDRPPQVDLEPARYIFFPNVPVKMRENLDNLDSW